MTRHIIGTEEEELAEALRHAFRDLEQLASRLRTRLDFEIDDVISRTSPYRAVAERVVQEFNSHGRVDELVAAALEARPENEKLRDFARRRSTERPLDEPAVAHAQLVLSDFERALAIAVARSRVDIERADRELVALRGKLDDIRTTLLDLIDAPLREPVATLAQQLVLRDHARLALLLLDELAPQISAGLTGPEHGGAPPAVRSLASAAAVVARRLRSIEELLADGQHADR